jgi:hypothetical protein
VATTLHIDTKLRVMTFEMRDALETLGIYGDDDVPTCMFCKREIAATMFGDHGDAPLDTVFQTDGTDIWCAECEERLGARREAEAGSGVRPGHGGFGHQGREAAHRHDARVTCDG